MKADIKFAVIPDTHIPYHNVRATEAALKLIRWYKPDKLIVLGDFLDYAPLSHWLKDNIATRGTLNLRDDFDKGNEVLDRLSFLCDDIVFIEGNHEDWAHQFVEANPEFRGTVEPEVGLKFKERRAAGIKIKHLRYNEAYRLGNLYFTHGTYTNQHHANKHVTSYGRSIVYGHLHTVQSSTIVSPIDVEHKHIGICMGCLCDKNPRFMRNRPNNWTHAVGLGTVRGCGDFNIDTAIISKGVVSYAGKTFSA